MKEVGDILLSEDFDLKVDNGDLVIGESTAQHQQCLLMAKKGDIKQAPTVGVDVFNEIDDERPEDLMRQIRLQFSKDGMKVDKLQVEQTANGKIKLNTKAFYED